MSLALGASDARMTRPPAEIRKDRLPPHAPGMSIGLLGGSFNPPHAAHRRLSIFAMNRLALDRVWWLVTPGNPLKETAQLPPLAQRVAAARRLAAHPRIDVTGIEDTFGTHYTADTLRELHRRCPGVRFVWIMGADNLAGLHRWRDWRGIAARVPLAIVDRAGKTLSATAGRAAQALAAFRKPESAARRLSYARPPAWVYLFGLKSPLSSTAIRAEKQRRGG